MRDCIAPVGAPPIASAMIIASMAACCLVPLASATPERAWRCWVMPDQDTIFTIGHSTRPIPDFVDLLRRGPADMVVDIRTVPRSRHNPQYNEAVLAEELAPYQIGYRRIGPLGGLRGRARDVPPEVNGFWENQSFHNYADYALSDEFAAALNELLALSSERHCAIMCAEAVWWRCHRRIVADYLLECGRPVIHLMGSDRLEPARLTSAARFDGERITYPRAA